MMSRRKVRTPRTIETVMFVRVKEAFDFRREEACARSAVAAGFGSAVIEKEVCVAMETTFVFVDKVVIIVVVVDVSVLVAKVTIVVSSIGGTMVRVVVTVGSGGKPGKEVGNGSPDKVGKGGNPNCLPNSVTAALPPPFVRIAGPDIQVLFSGRPRFSQSSVVQPAVVT
jgi:hypothetical protein